MDESESDFLDALRRAAALRQTEAFKRELDVLTGACIAETEPDAADDDDA